MGPGQCFCAVAKLGDEYCVIGSVRYTEDWENLESLVADCGRLLRIFSSSANYNSIRQELDLAAIYHHRESNNRLGLSWGSKEEDWRCPFPIIATCLIIGTSADPETGDCRYAINNWHDHPIRDSGGVVLDITDPSKPRYCFVGLSKDACRGPLSVSAFINDGPEPLSALPGPIEDFGLVSSNALHDIWPDIPWMETPTADKESVATGVGPQSLMGMSMKVFVYHSLDTEECGDELLHELSMNNNIRRELREFLTEHASEVEDSPVSGQLLKAAFSETEHVNLTPWVRLSIGAIGTILHWEHVSPYVKTVSISSRIGREDAGALAEALPPEGIEELYIIRGPSRDPGYPDGIYFDPHVSSKVRGKIILDSAYWHSLQQSRWLDGRKTIPFRGVDCPVLQMIERSNGFFNTTFLGDAALSPVSVVSGIFQALRLWSNDLHGYMNIPLAFASAPNSLEDRSQIEIRNIPADRWHPDWHPDSRILPDIRYLLESPDPLESQDLLLQKRRSRIRTLDHRTWTILASRFFLSKPMVPTFQICLVRTVRDIEVTQNSADDLWPEDLIVVDLEGFLRLTAPGVATDSLKALEKSLYDLRRRWNPPDRRFAVHTGEEIPVIETMTKGEAYNFVKDALSIATIGPPPKDTTEH